MLTGSDPDIARYLLSQTRTGRRADIRLLRSLRAHAAKQHQHGLWVNFGLTALDVALVLTADVLIGTELLLLHGDSPVTANPPVPGANPPRLHHLEDTWLGARSSRPGKWRKSRRGRAASIPELVAAGNRRVIKALDPSVPRAIEAASVGVISLGEWGKVATTDLHHVASDSPESRDFVESRLTLHWWPT